MSNKDFPRFITIEGGEGAGKTTVINHLEQILLACGLPVLKTREPGGTALGEQIRASLLNRSIEVEIGKKAELLMFLAARAQHIEEVIAPAISSGTIVLCDRFNDSTIAYQGLGRELGFPFVQDLCMLVCGPTLPDLTFYLDIPPQIGLHRTHRLNKENASAGEFDRIESETLQFHQQVRKAFEKIAQTEPNRFISVDASLPLENVVKICKQILLNRLGKDF